MILSKIVFTEAAMCPLCGPVNGRLTLTFIKRPLNVREYVCTECKSTFSPAYIAGHIAGSVYAKKRAK